MLAALVWSVILGAGTATAAQLTLTWTDNSGGLAAATEIVRRHATDTSFVRLGFVSAGVSRYVDATVTEGVAYCYRVRAYNVFGPSPYSAEACGNPAVTTFHITTMKAGDGLGTVTSYPTGISCGTDCTQTYPAGTVVSLSATPAVGSRFIGWSGGCVGTGACVVSANTAITVQAQFAKVVPMVSVFTANAGDGYGIVMSSPTGISCGTRCSATYTAGTKVVLMAMAGFGSQFTGWSGGCTGTATCVVGGATVLVRANFAKLKTFIPGDPLSGIRQDALPRGHAEVLGTPRSWLPKLDISRTYHAWLGVVWPMLSKTRESSTLHEKWQTRREAGTQSHGSGTFPDSRVAERRATCS